MDGFKITLPLPPSINALYGGGSKQKRFPSKAYKAWLASLPPLSAYYVEEVKELQYTYFFPDNRARDCENYIKAVSDYLVKQCVIKDDCWQCVPRLVIQSGGIDKKNPRVEINIRTDKACS